DLASGRRRQDLWLQHADSADGRPISTDSLGGRAGKWSPDGTRIAYLTSRGGTPQVWVYEVAGGGRRQVTSLSTGAEGPIWSPSGRMILFSSEVYPDCPDDACNRRRAEESAKRPSQARQYDELLFRHWNTWEDGLRSHLFVVASEGGAARDLLAGKEWESPVPPFGGSGDYAWSPDEREIAFTTKTGTGTEQAVSTDTDVYVVPVAGGVPVNATTGMGGAEQTPRYSADGSLLAFLSQERAGFESDRWRLMVKDRRTGEVREGPQGYDRPIAEYEFVGRTTDFFAIAEDRGRHEILHITAAGDVHHVTNREGNLVALSVGARDGAPVLAYLRDAIHQPAQVFVWRTDHRSAPRRLTHLNEAKLRDLALPAAEEIAWVGADGDSVRGFLLKPPHYQAGRRYPLVVLVHGGPQGAWLDQFHSRWNAQLFAAPGYVVLLPNPRGSTGYGQRFTDQISRDWGGRVFTDLMNGVDAVARLPYVDSTRMAAAGGSYGGYMANWINGHTNRFKALVSHAGVYNLEGMYGSTEELWFTEWEFGGPYWSNREDYERWSPHRFAQHFRTPTLVIHGALDYRVPDAEGMQLFTALRRQGVPARFLHFPDEGHWIGRPANQQVWWRGVQEWLGRYLATPTP
ncbi:MAG: prolyl oligopeptidase family serine peptidase, partial [Anaerolineales bacterium]